MEMISYFPQMYPDELLYSACARYKRHVDIHSQKDTVEILFRSRTQTATVDLPSNINLLLQQFSFNFITPDSLVKNHTLFPLYKPFLTLERVNKVRELMLSNPENESIHGTIGVMSHGISVPKTFRFCTECVKEDKATFGELYWHRSHQIPGAYFCYKHNQLLSETTLNYSGWGRKHNFVPLEHVIKEKLYLSPLVAVKNEHFLIKVSHMAADLLKQNWHPIGLESIQKKYKSFLANNGYITPKSNIRFKQLIDDFHDYFGHEFLFHISSDIQQKSDTWLHKVLRKTGVTCHPIRHILLLIFLKLELSDFKNCDNKKNDFFGEGPWPCLNKVASHYRQPVIDKCVITYCNKTKLPIGTFRCSCGFIYSRKGPDKSPNDRFEIDKVKCFGDIWITVCKNLSQDSSLSLREKAKKLGVDPKTVLKYSNNREPEKNNIDSSTKELEMEIRKNCLMTTICNLKNPTRTLVRWANPKDYTWLYRHNREWLYSVLPLSHRELSTKQRSKWELVDENVLTQVKKIIPTILKIEGKPIRITKAEISRRTENPKLIEYSLNKLPKTKYVLQNFLESTDEFQIRRINWVFDNWSKGYDLSCWRIKKLAGINKCSQFINNYLQIITNR